MSIGDAKIQIKIGDLDLTSSKKASYAGFNIYEDILNPYGPVAEIRVVDFGDALGSSQLNGAYDKDVEISLSGGDFASGDRKYKLKMFQNKNLNDQSINNYGSGHHKQYDIRSVSAELLNAQGNYMQKSYNDQTHKVVEDIVKKGFKSDKQIDIKSKTDGKRRIILNNVHPMKALHNLNSEHVSQEDKSSCFVLFQESSDQQKYVFATFEKLFKEQSTVTLKQRYDLDAGNATNQDRQNSIMWFKPSDNFFTATRSFSKTSEHSFNLTTHRVTAVDPKQDTQFKLIDNPVYQQGKGASYANAVPISTPLDKVNNKDKHTTAKAKTNRAAFLSHLMQNSAELETYYNPKIKLGSIITLDIPNKSDGDGEQGEKQFNGKVLVVAIRTKVKPAGQTPRVTMILRVVKASYKQGGNGDV